MPHTQSGEQLRHNILIACSGAQIREKNSSMNQSFCTQELWNTLYIEYFNAFVSYICLNTSMHASAYTHVQSKTILNLLFTPSNFTYRKPVRPTRAHAEWIARAKFSFTFSSLEPFSYNFDLLKKSMDQREECGTCLRAFLLITLRHLILVDGLLQEWI